jgi:hypothetical protein
MYFCQFRTFLVSHAFHNLNYVTQEIKITYFQPVLRSRSRIYWSEPEPYRDAAPAPTAPALKVLFNMGSFQKMTQTK